MTDETKLFFRVAILLLAIDPPRREPLARLFNTAIAAYADMQDAVHEMERQIFSVYELPFDEEPLHELAETWVAGSLSTVVPDLYDAVELDDNLRPRPMTYEEICKELLKASPLYR